MLTARSELRLVQENHTREISEAYRSSLSRFPPDVAPAVFDNDHVAVALLVNSARHETLKI